MADATDTDGGLSADQLAAWVGLCALTEVLPPVIESQLKRDLGVNLFEYTVLAMLSEEPDRTLPMSALAAVSFGSISRLSHAVGRLQRRGWLTKRAGTGSRRHNTVSLTDAGFEALAAAAPRHLADVRRLVVDPLTEADIRALARITLRLIAAAAPEVADLLGERLPIIIERNSATPT